MIQKPNRAVNKSRPSAPIAGGMKPSLLRRRPPPPPPVAAAAASPFRPILLLLLLPLSVVVAASFSSSPPSPGLAASPRRPPPPSRAGRRVLRPPPPPPSIVAEAAAAAALPLRPSPSPAVAPELRASSSSMSSSSDPDDDVGAASAAEGTPPADVVAEKVRLSTGTLMEIQTCVVPPAARKASGEKGDSIKPPLIFVHGSFHSGWCWTERYVPYFVSRGYPCVALSLAGTSGTDAGDGVSKVTIDRHADDLSALLDHVADAEGGLGLPGKPVLVAHSFGGLTAMKYLERPGCASRLSGVALLCSVPPDGIKGLVLRSLARSPIDAYRITRGLAMKKALTDPTLCRRLFFGGNDDDCEVSEEDLARYQSNFRRDTIATIDLSDLSKRLPSKFAGDDGVASYVENLSSKPLVMGGERDFIVDRRGVEETANFFGTEAVMVDGPHDVMLTNRWEEGAKVLSNWLDRDVVVVVRCSSSRGGAR